MCTGVVVPGTHEGGIAFEGAGVGVIETEGGLVVANSCFVSTWV